MNLNVVGGINNTSYGIVATRLIGAWEGLGHKPAVFPVNVWNMECDEEYKQAIQAGLNRAQMFDPKAPSIRIWHQFALDLFPGYGERIGFPIFELDTFNDVEKHHLSQVDSLIVCSNWAKEVVQQNLPEFNKPIFVSGLGVDTHIFSQLQLPKKEKTVFLNCGKWEYRKGHDILYKAFNDAFMPSDDVELWMLNYSIHDTPEENEVWANLYKNTAMGAGGQIKILPRQKSHKDVAKIMQQADCGVFPSRAEGWNLEMLEMLSCGKQVIATKCTAHTDMDCENVRWIDMPEKEVAFDGKWFKNKCGSWHKFGKNEVDSLIENMRAVHRNKQQFSRPSIIDKFTWNAVAHDIVAFCKGVE